MSDKPEHLTILGPDCKGTGQMILDGDGTIMGQFDGTVRVAGVLDLAESSQVSGTVVAGVVRLSGRADADVVAEHGVELRPGCVLTGRVFTAHLSVLDGASFEGEVVIGSHAMAAAADLIQQAGADGDAKTTGTKNRKSDAGLKPQTSTTSLDQALRARSGRKAAASVAAD